MIQKYNGRKSPKAAHILDYCRCLMTFETVDQILSALKILERRFQVCYYKNFFSKNEVNDKLDYRYINVYVICEHPKKRFIKLICEVRITLRVVCELDEQRAVFKSKECFGQVLSEEEVDEIAREVVNS